MQTLRRLLALVVCSAGGFITPGGLELAEVAGLKKYGHYTTSAEALYNLIQILRMTQGFAGMTAEARQKYFPDVDPSVDSLLTRKAAERLWARIQSKMVQPPAEKGGPGHSAGILAVDEHGNVAVILHSCNGILWGATGIFVDGISIPDSAVFQQRAIAEAGPGVRLPESTNPLLVLKGGKPVLASVAIGSALHDATLENLINVLDFGMDPETSVNQPNTRGHTWEWSQTHRGNPNTKRKQSAKPSFRNRCSTAWRLEANPSNSSLSMANSVIGLEFR